MVKSGWIATVGGIVAAGVFVLPGIGEEMNETGQKRTWRLENPH
jgi:hypothetical protein